MLSKLHDRLGTAGLIVAVVALVAALAGTAIAASGLNSKQKKEVKSIAKKFAGKRGPAGPAGATGPAGAKGEAGAPGTEGAPGKSVVMNTEAAGVNCPAGGVKFEVEGSTGKKYACNGSPWTAGGTLPAGATETGTWGGAVNKFKYKENETTGELEEVAGGASAFLPISIPIPLTAAPEPIFLSPLETEAPGCPGVNSEGTPEAEEGKLCVYARTFLGGTANQGFFDPTKNFAPGASPTGTLLGFECTNAECIAYGVWAVTAE
jgi:hypothetical protein